LIWIEQLAGSNAGAANRKDPSRLAAPIVQVGKSRIKFFL
jgi:hypothetical protein